MIARPMNGPVVMQMERRVPLGPGGLGLCRATAECTPRKIGDRWQCTRPSTRGGLCEVGPGPEGKCGCFVDRCTPARQVRYKRKVFVFCCAALTIGALAWALNSEQRRDILAPGPLTKQHAQLLAEPNVENRCASCHAAGDKTTSDWIVSTISLSNSSVSQSELCMNCHAKTLNASTATFAHGLDPKQLGVLTGIQSDIVASSAIQTQQEIGCSTCHREHHGSLHDLTSMSNSQCQICHKQQFESFEIGHPDFGKWPYDRRPNIAFDHASHSLRHYRREGAEFNCNDCHTESTKAGATGADVISVTSYEACSKCHEKKLGTSLADGIAFFRLPIVDTETLLDNGFDIGQWPLRASGDFDGSLPELMRLLLVADAVGRSALDKLGHDFDFYDTDPDDREQLKKVTQLLLGD